ncbi:hypothetical protein [Deinococcus yavapaiensis]|uniref:Uncharacterized protein n=1 Tax=Deinococcus yavapaiensis KR-236 TaxID=694435 RepID=A0A318S011_9DEIO|nr:hypothetical protein [Deinococcus yavapaiensis]PYE49905.1 hypothetical protein DES52_12137 [Deinococcus yavapaiensis KR-236]
MKRRTRTAGIVLAALASIFGACQSRREVGAPPPVGALEVRAHVRSGAARVVVTGASPTDLPNGTVVALELATPAGPLVVRQTARAGRAAFTVPYRRAGRLVYRVTAGNTSRRGSLDVEAGRAVRIDAQTQPRASRVTGERPPLLVAQALDAFGNVPDRPSNVRVFAPDGTRSVRELRPTHLLSWTLLEAGEDVGTLDVSVTTDEARRELVVADLTPGRTAEVALDTRRRAAYADGRDRWRLDARDVRDALGNDVVDGTALTFYASGPDGVTFSATLPAVSGERPLDLTPPEPGRYTFTVRAEDASSSTLDLTARPGLVRGSLRARREGRVIVLGPLVTTRGARPDTGTPVSVSVLATNERVLREDVTAVGNGVARYELPVLPSAARVVRLEVLGERFDVSLTGEDGP